MHMPTSTLAPPCLTTPAREPAPLTPAPPVSCSLLVLGFMILLINLPLLLSGTPNAPLALHTGSAYAWWQPLTHAFVHVSRYHLLIDASAFLCIYAELRMLRTASRLSLTAVCVLGALLGAILSPATATVGYSGLSGAAHGLFAAWGLQLACTSPDDRLLRHAGLAAVLLVLAKSLYELLAGQVCFASLHLGHVGTPIVACHLAGALAGLLWMTAHLIRHPAKPCRAHLLPHT